MNGPIIVGGCMRSGTTLLSTILDTHSNIACGPETQLFSGVDGIKRVLYLLRLSYRSSIFSQKQFDKIKHRLLHYPHVDEVAINKYFRKSAKSRSRFAQMFLDEYVRFKKKKRWAEKTPGNTFFLKELARYWPNAYFVHIVRDFRDVYLSLQQYHNEYAKNTNKRYSIYRAAYYWRRNMDFVRQRKAARGKTFILRYEDLVLETEETLKSLFEFLQENFEEECLHYYKNKHDRLNKKHNYKIRQNVDRTNVFKYKYLLNDKEQNLSLKLCGDVLRYFNYET